MSRLALANIIKSRLRIKPSDEVWAYPDTIQLFFATYPKLPKGRWLGVVRRGKRWGWVLTLHQPTIRQLTALDKLGGSVSRLDISIDYINHNPDRLRNYILHHMVLPHSKKWEMQDIGELTYWIKYPKGKRRGSKQAVLYGDRTSKVTGQLCIHLELRLLTAGEVKSAGVTIPSDVINLNPHELFKENTEWVNAEINQYLKQQRRMGTKHEVAINNLKRITQFRAQNIRRTHPQITLSTISSTPLPMPLELHINSKTVGLNARDHAGPRGKTWTE